MALPWTRRNVYFADSTSSTVSVVYRGGHRRLRLHRAGEPRPRGASPNGQVTVEYLPHRGEINWALARLDIQRRRHHDNAPAFEKPPSRAPPWAHPAPVPPRLRWTAREISISRIMETRRCG